MRNALNLRSWQRIAEGMKELDADPDVRVIIMRGATPEAFIAGADISEFPAMRANADQARAYRDAPANAISSMLESPKPVIGMLSGVCIGGGLQVGLSCDIRIAARGTRFGVPAARLGLAYPLDGVTALINVVGPANARDILLSARLFDTDEAMAMGLVNRVVEGAQLEESGARLCDQDGDQRAADDARGENRDSRIAQGPGASRRQDASPRWSRNASTAKTIARG